METLNTKRGPVHICTSKHELGLASAKDFAGLAAEAIAKRGRFTVGLSGGHTPPLLYEQLTTSELKDQVDWSKVHFFISDERCVPHSSKDSNWGMAQTLLFEKLNIKAENLHSMQDEEKNPAQSALHYETAIQNFFSLKPGEMPRFDLIQLGMGPDGHTASLFPGSKALGEEKRIVVENFADKLETYRITFTFTAINNAANVMFMVEGQEKSHVLAEVLQSDQVAYPVQHIKPSNGKVVWFVDEAAAHDLKLSGSRK